MIAVFPFILMVIEYLISVFISTTVPYSFFITLHLTLLSFLFISKKLEYKSNFCLLFFVGLTHDCFYFQSLPIACFIYPLQISLLNYYYEFLKSFVIRLLSAIILISLFDLSAYWMAWGYGVTKLSFSTFIAYNLLPTLVTNAVIFISMELLIFKKIRIN